MNRRAVIGGSFLLAGAVMVARHEHLFDPPPLSTAGSPIFVGGWKFPDTQIFQGIDNSEAVRSMSKRLHLNGLGDFLKSYASSRHFAHLYLRIGEYDMHGLPTDPKTGETKDFQHLQGTVLRVVVLSPAEAVAEHKKHAGECLPLVPLALSSQQPPTQLLAHALDVANEINKRRMPYEAATWRIFNPLSHSPTNSNAAMSTVARSIGARPANRSRSLEGVYPDCTFPGAECDMAPQLKNAGSWFQDAVVKNGWKMEQLVEAFREQMQKMFSASGIDRQPFGGPDRTLAFTPR